MTVSDLLGAINVVDKNTISAVEKKQLCNAAQQLLAKVQNPWDCLNRIIWGQVSSGGEKITFRALHVQF